MDKARARADKIDGPAFVRRRGGVMSRRRQAAAEIKQAKKKR